MAGGVGVGKRVMRQRRAKSESDVWDLLVSGRPESGQQEQ